MSFIVGDVLGALCTLIGYSVFRDIRGTVLLGMKTNLEVQRRDCGKSDDTSKLSQVSVTTNLLIVKTASVYWDILSFMTLRCVPKKHPQHF